ncbi:4-hydroxybenzoyl-CoA thioesterase [Enterococcus florum]|uniref:4-hydroxybenzoyl-CoA thioesterase n=1 Tax=Enterococcus florum TaxID=2480627 RepID=A0A4V0WPG4_9ENTE|nr:acyl-CoA thioesterase [Enterococcus florum]GCF93769.1 4-hydroxybenzoyl-CoA thioesterase [Enterococcus florum]
MEHYAGYVRKPFYYETDKMGIIHHSNYIRWFEEARVDLLDFLDYSFDKIEADGIIVPVLGVSAAYKEMVRFGDEVLIRPFINKYTSTRLHFDYVITNQATGKIVTTGTSEHCFMSSETKRLVHLKKQHPELHALFQAYDALDQEMRN